MITEYFEINDKGDKLPITVEKINDNHVIKIDGVVWVETTNYTHATVLFNMLRDHITEYMTYRKV